MIVWNRSDRLPGGARTRGGAGSKPGERAGWNKREIQGVNHERSGMTGVAEAVVLGFASGPVCVASCGPVLLPWLAAEPRGLRATGQLLGVFLGGRLAGYLAFAVIAWTAGVALPVDAGTRTLIFGLANLGLGSVAGGLSRFPAPPLRVAAGRRRRAGRSQRC